MTRLGDWLSGKYIEWEKTQGKAQSYYAFSRYIGVSHSSLTQWITGIGSPEGDDLEKIADRLGSEIYTILDRPLPIVSDQAVDTAFANLPLAFRERLTNAILEADRVVRERHLEPESLEAKQRIVRVFERWGFIIRNPPRAK